MLPIPTDKTVETILRYLPQVTAGLFTFFIFWIISLIVKKVLPGVRIPKHGNALFKEPVLQSIRSIILIIGAVTALGTMGLNISAIVASLGLVGFAVGFALKDALSNFLAGMLVLIYRPFRIDDEIKVANFEGKVIEINFRYTVLSSNGDKILIPNSTLFTNSIIVKNR